MTADPASELWATVPKRAVPTVTVSERAQLTRRSAIWAAWGDALGFPSELVPDTDALRRRVGEDRVETTGAWRRRIGGRMGVIVELPAGMYSDDTQLRLAVSRSIRAADRFDVEVFSKIELPVFLSYGFGIGRGTRAAAQSLSKRSVRWYSNFFEARNANYLDGGGNGAAMRVQPHVWASSRLDPTLVLSNVVRDAVVTHGHVRGILGAAFHASSLALALNDVNPPEPAQWEDLVGLLPAVVEVVKSDESLNERWRPEWERRSGRTFASAVQEGVDELRTLVAVAATETTRSKESIDTRYAALADAIGGREPATRGAGTISAVLAVWLAHACRGDAVSAILHAANLLGSDTDTVASMTGALVGPSSGDLLPGPLVDLPLIASEAERLAKLANGDVELGFAHPDPLRWQPPKTQADSLGTLDGKLVVAGLGPGREQSKPLIAQDGSLWQWVELQMGQTVLLKRRAELPRLPAHAGPQERLIAAPAAKGADGAPGQQTLLAGDGPEEMPLAPVLSVAQPTQTSGTSDAPKLPDSIEAAVAAVVKSRFERILTSRLLFSYALQEDGSTKAALFAARVADALRESERKARPPTQR